MVLRRLLDKGWGAIERVLEADYSFFSSHKPDSITEKLPVEKNKKEIVSEQFLKQRQFWNEYAKRKRGRTGCVGFYRLRELIFVISNLKGKQILDCGCGDGVFMRNVNVFRPSKKFVGIDYSDEMVKIGQKMNLDVKRMNMADLDFKSKSFDTTYEIRAVKNILEPKWQKKALSEICRVTKSRVIIIDGILEGYHGQVPEFNRYLSESELIKEMSSNGFSLTKKIYFSDPLLFWRKQTTPIGEEGFFIFDHNPN